MDEVVENMRNNNQNLLGENQRMKKLLLQVKEQNGSRWQSIVSIWSNHYDIMSRWTSGKKGDFHYHCSEFLSTSGTGLRSSVTVSVGRPKLCERNWIEETEGSPRVIS